MALNELDFQMVRRALTLLRPAKAQTKLSDDCMFVFSMDDPIECPECHREIDPDDMMLDDHCIYCGAWW